MEKGEKTAWTLGHLDRIESVRRKTAETTSVLLAASILSLGLEASMLKMRPAVATLLLVAASAALLAQDKVEFEVVSIKRNTSGALGSNGSSERPNGGFTLLNVPITTLIARGYLSNMPIPVSLLGGLPGWANVTGEHYDIVAKSSLSRPATPDERQAMVRALLADRFKLVTHLENREQETYDLVFARADHRLGPNIKPSEPGCEAKLAAETAAMQAARAEGRPLPLPDRGNSTCRRWMMGSPADGDITMDQLTSSVGFATLRPVTNKTGLTGSYRITLTFDFGSALRGPDVAPNQNALPTVFVALQDQLGLKLEPVKAAKETLVIDHLERPSEN
jgi:uncharacterized protein (TIGR03435 family)